MIGSRLCSLPRLGLHVPSGSPADTAYQLGQGEEISSVRMSVIAELMFNSLFNSSSEISIQFDI